MATAVREPRFQTIIHLPGLPGSFVYRKKGKYRLDQAVRNFCLNHAAKGCFEVKVHFPASINPKRIKYDATSECITVDTLEDHPRHHFKLKVTYPEGLELEIPSDPEAQFVFGILSCKLAILNYDKGKVMAFHNKRKWKDRQLSSTKTLEERVEDDETLLFRSGNEALTEGARHRRKLLQRKMRKQRRDAKRKAIEGKRLSMDQLNQRIAQNALKSKVNAKKTEIKADGVGDGVGINVMSINDQHSFIDGVVDRIDERAKEQRKRDYDKDQDLREYKMAKKEKYERKLQRKAALKEKFQKRYEKKRMKKDKNYIPKTDQSAPEEMVRKVKHDDELMRDYATAFD